MTVERTDNEIIIRISGDTNIDIEEIQGFLDYLTYKEIVSKSKAKAEDIQQLADEVDKGWWDRNKGRFLKDQN